MRYKLLSKRKGVSQWLFNNVIICNYIFIIVMLNYSYISFSVDITKNSNITHLDVHCNIHIASLVIQLNRHNIMSLVGRDVIYKIIISPIKSYRGIKLSLDTQLYKKKSIIILLLLSVESTLVVMLMLSARTMKL